MSFNKKWYALRIKTGYEKKVVSYLSKRKCEFYYPVTNLENAPGDNTKRIHFSLFSLVFIHAAITDYKYLQIPGVLSLLYWLKVPAIFQAIDIEILCRFLYEYPVVKVAPISVGINERVKLITSGFAQREDESKKNSEIQLVFPSLGFVLSSKAEIQRVEKFTERPASQTKIYKTFEILIKFYFSFHRLQF